MFKTFCFTFCKLHNFILKIWMILYISPAYRISSNSFVSSAPLIITVINSISMIMKSDDKQFLTGILIDISIRQHTKKYTDNAVYKYYKTYIKSIRALQKPSHHRSSDQFFCDWHWWCQFSTDNTNISCYHHATLKVILFYRLLRKITHKASLQAAIILDSRM